MKIEATLPVARLAADVPGAMAVFESLGIEYSCAGDQSLIDLQRHLESEHHRFVRDEMAVLALRLSDLCTAPSGASPELHSLRAAFTKLSDLILPHMRDEEQEVFPVIEALENFGARIPRHDRQARQ